MSDEKFLQFPLCALAMESQKYTLINRLINFGLLEAGKSIFGGLSLVKRKEACIEHNLKESECDSWELVAHLGAKVCNLKLGTIKNSISDYHLVHKFRDAWEERNGAEPIVRMKKDILLSVRDSDEKLNFREFRVLCAIYSSIGAAPYKIVPARMIRVRAVGCKSEAVERNERNGAAVLPPLLTVKQLRSTITRLHQTGWFARVTPDRHGRLTYYSNRLVEDALAEKIVTRRTYAAIHAEGRKQLTEKLSLRIKQKKGNFNRDEIPTELPENRG